MSRPGRDRADLIPVLLAEIGRVSSLSVLFSHAVADRVGMNPTDLEALDILRRDGAMPAGRLAELTGLTTGAVTGLVDRLERRGYARRDLDPTDRRRVIVRPLTENAERDLGSLFASMGQAMGDLVSRFSDQQLAIILEFIERANEVVVGEIAKVKLDEETVTPN